MVVVFGILAYTVISGIRRHKEWKDAWNECDDSEVPDLRKDWCRNCKGHHGIIYGGGEHQASKCRDCDSTGVYRVSPITLWKKFSYSLPTLIVFTFGTFFLAMLGWRGQPMTYLCYGLAVIFAFGFAYVYRLKSAVRNEWLIWAKERGYKENAEKTESN